MYFCRIKNNCLFMNKINNYFLYIDFSLVNKVLFVFLLVFGLNTVNAQLVTETVTATGSGTFVPPSGVTSIRVEAWGAGGRGGQRSNSGRGGGGGGGAYSRGIVSVTAGQTYYYQVGVGSTTTSAGGGSWFNVSNIAPTSNNYVLAVGGNSAPNNSNSGATGGAATSGYGNVIKYGGGDGGAGRSGSQGAGNAGNAPGGGGGGAYRTSIFTTQTGGAGARGQIRITYLPAITGTANLGVNGTSTLSNSVSGGTWSSSNPTVATVNPTTGLVTANTTGITSIIYTTPDGLSRFVDVFVVTIIDDGDGIPIGTDLDSDNDGIPDCVEKGLS